MVNSCEKDAIGIVGVGNMGGAIAENLLARGWRVGVHDIDDHKTRALVACGARAVQTPSALADFCNIIIIAVVDAHQVEEVFSAHSVALSSDSKSQPHSHPHPHPAKHSGLLSAIGPGHTVLLCPTISPKDVIRFAQAIEERGAAVIDAPMSGGPVRARTGQMSLMVACSNALYEKQQSLLNAIAAPVFFISERVGDGAKTKLINNLLAGINLVASAELFAMAEKLGLDLQTTLSVIQASSGQSWVGSERMGRAIASDPLKLTPLAHMTLLEKDTRLALEMGLEVGYSGPLGASAVKTFKEASACGLANCDDAAMLEFLRSYKSE